MYWNIYFWGGSVPKLLREWPVGFSYWGWSPITTWTALMCISVSPICTMEKMVMTLSICDAGKGRALIAFRTRPDSEEATP